MTLLHLLSLFVILTLFNGCNCDGCGLCAPHRPFNGWNHLVTFNEFVSNDESFSYPPKMNTSTLRHLFVNDFNFDDAPEGTVFVGARNALYQFNKDDLSVDKQYVWEADATDKTYCEGTDPHDKDIACQNHVRLYRTVPFGDAAGRLFVCGTNAYKPVCRTIDLNDISNSSLYGLNVTVLDVGVISLHPFLPFIGDFLDDGTEYQTTGYIKSHDLNMFDFARYSVSYNSADQTVNFGTTPVRNIDTSSSDFYIRMPYLPIKMRKLDLDGSENFRMFYFFIRERKYYQPETDDVPARARVIRVCQKDDGLGTLYKTFFKMEIMCYGDAPNTPAAVGAQRRYYTVLRDIVWMEYRSRWNGNSDVWFQMAYGIFTGDVYGPNGTAVCVYHANFTDVNTILDMSHRGLIDVFSFTRYRDEQGDPQDLTYNMLDCDRANNRDVGVADHIIGVDPIVQYRGLPLPLLEMEGETLTKLTVDQVCVRVHDNSSKCLMQDVLFVGNDKGRVKKIVFTTLDQYTDLDGVLSHDAVVAQEWELADDNSVTQLKIDGDNIYVGTHTRMYKMPIADCSRHGSCGNCIGSRDPYCFWNKTSNMCERNTVGSSESVYFDINSDEFIQNIHLGEDPVCNMSANCTLTASADKPNTIEINGLNTCNYTLSSYSVTITPVGKCGGETVTATITEDDSSITDDAILGRRVYKVEVTAFGISDINANYTLFVLTTNGAPVTPTSEEVSARSINESYVEVSVYIDGCNVHDSFENYTIDVTFGESVAQSQQFSGVNTFVSGPYNGSQSVNYNITVRNDHGSVMSDTFSVSTRSSPPNSPKDLRLTSDVSSVSLVWTADSSSLSAITGYSISVDGVKRTDCSTTDTTYTLEGLYSYTNYSVSVTACSAGGESDPVSASITTSCESPSQVINLNNIVADSSYLIFEWDEPSYVNGSNLGYRVKSQCYNKQTLMVEDTIEMSNSTNYTMINLQPLMRCCVSVSVVVRCNDSLYYSEEEFVCGTTSEGIPGPVDQLMVESTNPETLYVSWSPPVNYTDPSLKYEVKLWTANAENDTDLVLDQYYCILDGLNQLTEYTVTVIPFSSVGRGTSTSVNITTLADIPSVPPTNVALNFTNEDCNMTVTWTFDNADAYNVTKYNIRAYCSGESYTAQTSEMSHVFENVCKDNTVSYIWCTAQVQAVNYLGGGRYSAVGEALFPQMPPPTPSCISIRDGNSANISYTITRPYALDQLTVNYMIEPPSLGVPSSMSDFEESNTVVYFSQLDRLQEYNFLLQLCDINGCSNPCRLTFTTTNEGPSPPINITTTDTFETGFEISWLPPEDEAIETLTFTVWVSSINYPGQEHVYRNITSTSIRITDLLSSTDYSYVVQSVFKSMNISGRFSNPISVETTTGRPTPADISSAVFYNQNLTVSWSLVFPRNGTVEGFMITWNTAQFVAGDNCDLVQQSNGQSMMISNPNATSVTLGANVPSNAPETGIVCIRSVNTIGMSEWDYSNFDISDLMLSSEAVAQDNESRDIGILAAVVILALIAIVVAIVLAVCLVYALFKYKTFFNSPPNVGVDSEIPLGSVSGQDSPDASYMTKNGRKRATPVKREESTKSTSSRRLMLRRDSENSGGGGEKSGNCSLA